LPCFSVENLTGSAFVDELYADGAANVLRGLGGNDELSGDSGNDTIEGGDGNDRIWAGTGDDTVTGGVGGDQIVANSGADLIVFTQVADSTSTAFDDILDFSSAQGDRIDLRQIDANTGVAGDQAFIFIGQSGFTGVAGQLRMNSAGAEWFIDGDVNGDGTADLQVRVNTLLQASDFLF
jgi:serralysin